MKSKILLLEDDELIAGGLLYALEKEGFDATHAKTIRDAKEILSEQSFHLAILDMQLPDGLGSEIHTHLLDTDTAVIYVTVIDDEGRIVKSFEKGAADYITKPFRLRELLARVKRALVSTPTAESAVIIVGSLKIDLDVALVFIDDTKVDLTALEYRLLVTFANNKGRILTRNQILDLLWDSAGNFIEDNTLTVYIKRLRQKVGAAVTITTVRGMGYRLDVDQ